MEITRDNYMDWLSDYHDGKLNSEQEEILAGFLEGELSLESDSALYDLPVLRPDISLRINKESLKRDFSDLSADQRDEIMIALSEGDISDEDSDELIRLIESDPYLDKSYRTILKTRLTAPDIIFPGKAKLKRIPLLHTVRRIGVNSLAAAAVAIILFSIWTLVRPVENATEGSQATLFTIDDPSSSNEVKVSRVTTSEEPAENKIASAVNTPASSRPSPNQEEAVNPEKEIPIHDNPIFPVTREEITIEAAPASTAVSLEAPIISTRLAEMVPLEIEPEQGSLSPREFIAKNFRTLILKENEAGTDRLKGYEVADATVIGVNKLMGWEMKLDKEKDDLGNLNSLKFTSQLIKFDHRVKNSTDSL